MVVNCSGHFHGFTQKMQAVDDEVLGAICRWLGDGRRCWLATVIETWGSSPRPVGSLFACDEGGSIAGSLSGGCVEDDLLEKLTGGELARDRAQYFQYGVTTEETEKFGLPCGGSLHIVIEPLTPDAETLQHFTELRDQLSARQHAERRVELRARRMSLRQVEAHAPLRWDADSEALIHTYGPRHQLFIIGAGMVSKYLAELALKLDYQVRVCDPREHLLNEFGVPGVMLINDMPDDAVSKFADDPASAIVALTHDPRIDDMGLMEALHTRAFYVGAMGSTRTSASRRERLLALDLSAREIDRLHAPIGLPIGSKTPPEIAIAIMAEIIAIRQHALVETQESLAAATAG